MPRLLDLFGGEGLAAYGYAEVGWQVTSVENDPERLASAVRDGRIEHVLGDAMTWPLDGYDAVHASPPCTDHTTLAVVAEAARGADTDTGWMLPATIARLQAWGARTERPWVVENVQGARGYMINPFRLCGSMFDLTDGGWLLRRHRYFESNALVMMPGPCTCHGRKIIGVYGDLTANDRCCAGTRLDRPNGDTRAGVARARRLMGAPWASPRGLALGIPPAYTRWIGEQLMINYAHSEHAPDTKTPRTVDLDRVRAGRVR